MEVIEQVDMAPLLCHVKRGHWLLTGGTASAIEDFRIAGNEESSD